VQHGPMGARMTELRQTGDADRDLSWSSNTSSSEPSKRSAQRCVPVTASISWPVMRTRCPAFRTEPFEDIADAQFAADLLHVDGAALIGEAKLRAITNSQRIRESAVMIYSTTMPSTKIHLLRIAVDYWQTVAPRSTTIPGAAAPAEPALTGSWRRPQG
jgi:hypothetical protein